MSTSRAAAGSRDEIAQAIRAFTPANWARLRSAARYFGLGRGLNPKDLLQEALMRAVDTRNCPQDVDVMKFVVGIVRSVAHGEGDKAESKVVLVPIANTGGETDPVCAIADEADDPEAQVLAAERSETCRKMHGEIVALFSDDQVALLILEGLMEEMTVEELLDLTGLDKKAYASKRKLIRRRIDKHYPDGWKP